MRVLINTSRIALDILTPSLLPAAPLLIFTTLKGASRTTALEGRFVVVPAADSQIFNRIIQALIVDRSQIHHILFQLWFGSVSERTQVARAFEKEHEPKQLPTPTGSIHPG
jgi:hypothetical protein